MPRRGRPRKASEVDEAIVPLSDLIQSPQYFESDMRDFFHSGIPYRLQRWFIAAGSQEKADQIKVHMLTWFDQQLDTIMPPWGEP